jgi:acetyl esterase
VADHTLSGSSAALDSGADELVALLDRLEEAGVTEPEAWPEPAPADGQSIDDWRAETTRLREQHDAKVLEIRRLTEAISPPEPVAATFYTALATERAALNARIYVPAAAKDAPCLLFLHGGGWWMAGGSVGFEINDPLCRMLCNGLGATVVNVDYRLAPEHPFPQALHDVYDVLCLLHRDGPDLFEIDPQRIAVMGNSSGGNLAAALCIYARDKGGPPLRAQLLHVPALDLTAAQEMEDDESKATSARVRALYAGAQADLSQPLLSPALAPDVSGLPPAVIVLAELDPLRDEGRRYGEHLAAAGVTVEVFEYRMAHTVAAPPVVARWTTDLIESARRHL